MVGRFYLVGILIGLTAGTIATSIGGLIAGLFLGFGGVDLGHDFTKSTPFAVSLLIVTSIGSVVSGFVTARNSPGNPIFDVGATGFVLLLLSLAPFIDSETAIFPFWCNVSMLLLAAPLALTGGRLQSRRWRSN